MKLTRNAIIFAIINALSTVVFLTKLNDMVVSRNFDQIAPWAIVYGLIWAISGAILGITDKARAYRGNVDFQYTLISSVIGVLALWLSKLLLPSIMPVGYGTLILMTLTVTAATGIQYYFANRSPKGIDKKEAFK
jgi:H+/Cl- antiporter ClcA